MGSRGGLETTKHPAVRAQENTDAELLPPARPHTQGGRVPGAALGPPTRGLETKRGRGPAGWSGLCPCPAPARLAGRIPVLIYGGQGGPDAPASGCVACRWTFPGASTRPAPRRAAPAHTAHPPPARPAPRRPPPRNARDLAVGHQRPEGVKYQQLLNKWSLGEPQDLSGVQAGPRDQRWQVPWSPPPRPRAQTLSGIRVFADAPPPDDPCPCGRRDIATKDHMRTRGRGCSLRPQERPPRPLPVVVVRLPRDTCQGSVDTGPPDRTTPLLRSQLGGLGRGGGPPFRNLPWAQCLPQPQLSCYRGWVGALTRQLHPELPEAS